MVCRHHALLFAALLVAGVKADSNPISDPAVIGGIAGVVVLLLIVIWCCCRKRASGRLKNRMWQTSQELFMEKLHSLNAAVQTVVDDQIQRGLTARIAACDAAAPSKRGDVVVPATDRIPASSLHLRKCVSEDAYINQPIVETGLLAYQGIASALKAFGPLLYFPLDSDAAVAHHDDDDPSTGYSCGRRCLCICASHEHEQLIKSRMLLMKGLSKAFIAKLPDAKLLARFHTRGWIHESVLSLLLAVQRRQRLENGDHEPREMTAVHFSVPIRTDAGAQVDIIDLAERNTLTTLYIRTCGTDSRATTLLELRHDVVSFINTVSHLVLETALLGNAKATLPLFNAAHVIDQTLARALYGRRALALDKISEFWRNSASNRVQAGFNEAKQRCIDEAFALGSSETYVNRRPDDPNAKPVPTVEEMTNFSNNHLDTTIEQYKRAFKANPVEEPDSTRASCCGYCLPDYPVVRRIVSGEKELFDHLCNQFNARASAQLAIRDDDKETAMKLLSDLKLSILDIVEPNESSSPRAEDGEEWSEPEDELNNTNASVPASPPRDTGEVFILPAEAYKWVPPGLAEDFVDMWENAPEDALAEVARVASKELDALEKQVMVSLCAHDPNYVALQTGTIQQMVGSSQVYLAELAAVVTTFRKIHRLSRDACSAARTRQLAPLRTIMSELNGLLRKVRQEPAFEAYRDWIDLKRIVKSFNAHAKLLEQSTGSRRAASSSAYSNAEHDFAEAGDQASPPEPPPRDV